MISLMLVMLSGIQHDPAKWKDLHIDAAVSISKEPGKNLQSSVECSQRISARENWRCKKQN